VAIKDKAKALENLKSAHGQLATILEQEGQQLELSIQQTRVVDIALKWANPQEGDIKPSSISTTAHPLLAGLRIAQAHRAALEDLASSIQTSQTEMDTAQLQASGRGPTIPFIPHRSVEDQVAVKSHRCWGLSNINLLAPITINMWKTWSCMTKEEVDGLEVHTIHSIGLLREAHDIPNGFPLSTFDRQKCASTNVKVHTKQYLQTGFVRNEKYSSSLWNCQRPYIRCTCSQNALSGCRGDVMWFDHSVWYMLNNLELFFDNELPTLVAKFGAFLVWIRDAARIAVKYQITFAFSRAMMVEASIEFAADPTAKLLPEYKDAAGARQIERLIKPAAFSVANPGTPSPGLSGKRNWSKMNLNISPELRTTPPTSYSRPTRGAYHGHPSGRSGNRGGRGGYNRNYRPSESTAPNPNEAFVFLSASRRSPASPRSGRQINSPPPSQMSQMHSNTPFPSWSHQPPQVPNTSRNDGSSSRTTPRFFFFFFFFFLKKETKRPLQINHKEKYNPAPTAA
jgi:hypothetical protein